ncbi:MAG: IclR family transcriptional regulator [Burkholderiaceae bacterium]|nr:IclR family transcriptional regulator [Burkholderiaceae bacterium]
MPPSTATVLLSSPRESPPSSVERAIRILRVMSDGSKSRLTDIALAAGLDKATALRLLEVLERDGFVARNPQTKLFTLGPELRVLGAAALQRFDPRPVVRPSLMRLTGAFQDSVVLSIPSGSESLCIHVEEGSYPIRANYLTVGSRRPLGVGAGSLALLAWMTPAEREAVLEVMAGQLGRYPRITPALLQERIAQARERGYALLLDVVVERMGGMAVPILDADGHPVAAISITGLNDRILAREAAMAQALKREATVCQVLWSEATRPAATEPRPARKAAPRATPAPRP